LSEAYFWKNDFYPYTKAELIEYDPKGAEAVRMLWDERLANFAIPLTTFAGLTWLFLSLFV
jgi:hypothetical protein